MNNIFNIPNAENKFCHVHFYATGHSVLELRFFDPLSQHIFSLVFLGVKYFSGAMGWKSADFTLGSPDEVLEISRQSLGSKLPDDFILEYYSLYKVDLATPPVRILAAKRDLTGENYTQITLDDG